MTALHMAWAGIITGMVTEIRDGNIQIGSPYSQGQATSGVANSANYAGIVTILSQVILPLC